MKCVSVLRYAVEVTHNDGLHLELLVLNTKVVSKMQFTENRYMQVDETV